jgi:hypothetical protein
MDKRITNSVALNAVYLVTITLAIIVLVFGYQRYQERHEASGLEINVGGKTISIETR